MARLLMSGNELNDYRAEGWTDFSGTPTTSTNQPGGRKSVQGNGGLYYFYLAASTGMNQIAHLLPNVATGPAVGGYTEVYGRFAYYGGGSRNTRHMIILRNSNTGLNVGSIEQVDQGSGTLAFLQLQNGAGSSFGQSALTFDTSIWNRIEFHFKCAASGGIFEIWVNDTLYLSLSGLNTSNGSTQVFDQIIIGQTDVTNVISAFDDIAINDLTGTVNNGRCGEGLIIALLPARTGTYSQLQNAYGTSIENYDHVNRRYQAYNDPQNNSLYVGTNNPFAKDLYRGPSLPQEIGAIAAAKVVASAVRNGAGITNAKLLLQPGVQASITPITPGAPSAGGLGTNGTHLFAVVNKIGGAYSMPSPLSSVVTLGSGNNQVPLTVPIYVTAQGIQVTAREIYASKANTDTTIAAGSNGAVLPQATINVASTANLAAGPGTVLIQTTDGRLQTVNYTALSGGNQLTGCSGGVGTLATNAPVVQALYFVGVINDNVTTSFTFGTGVPATNGADGSFSTLQAPSEIASSNVALPNGAYGGIENIFDHNPTTGLAFTRDEMEYMEQGLQFVP